MSSLLRELGVAGQAVWLDFVSREFLRKGELQTLIERDGLTGVTSNPSIFEKAMGHGTDYDASLERFLNRADASPVDVYEYLAVEDIQQAADILRPVYDRLNGRDGYVSLEVSPYLAMDTEATLIEARRLWKAVDRPNLMVKVPGTEAGAAAIQQLIAEGINVNVTLLFSRESYRAVAEAYMAGLEARAQAGEDISRIASVASFFISRIDSEIEKKIDEKLKAGGDEATLKSLKGRVAIANAKLAYADYQTMMASERWQALAAKGAQPQRLLWASTGTKNPEYPDTLYVDELIGPDTVNTMPPKTMDAFRDHGTVRETITQGLDEARATLEAVERLGLDLPGVTADLVTAGAKLFSDAADDLLGAVGGKRLKLLAGKLNQAAFSLPDDLSQAVEQQLEVARREGWSRRLWEVDASLWTNQDEAKWGGWLKVATEPHINTSALVILEQSLKAEGYTTAVLLGMGGSSLGPEVLAKTLGTTPEGLRLHVLDSTDPAQIAAVEHSIDYACTVFLVSSKSGSTLEPEILSTYFFDAACKAVGREQAGHNFIAVTDPGSKLESSAKAQGYRTLFYGDPTIGGRYSVLSAFGLVPLSLLGHDVDSVFEINRPMVLACGPSAPPSINPGVYLGVVMGEAVKAGRDKLTLFASPQVASIGAWLEQLLAESTGKQGKGIIPVDLEPPTDPSHYGDDRLFVYLRADNDGSELDAQVDALEKAGHPVVRINLMRPDLIGQEFFRWEVATAMAGAVIGINPFDQPDVEASKIKTRELTDEYEKTGQLSSETPFFTDGELAFYSNAPLEGDSAEQVLKEHFTRLNPGDYAAILAYIERNGAHEALLTRLRTLLRDRYRVATVGGFGPRFLHSTGQAYKGGPNSGVFLQITAEPQQDLAIPGRKVSFGIVEAAQAQGDLSVLAERGRRHLRIHIQHGNSEAGLQRIVQLVEAAIA
ncbi:glucose-6-phosphate isomerase [Pseudomonas asuensis]|uniref:Transaldolase n=1 Tax=Pseudomonas asuensis TaxID=1825787 RepID=A0ABQ2GVQ0_9PSED|nr:bifunctional transaldolase/phosoglucose isomerase [Pseudomonas asuensis]GGM13163.1 glucose-6-phosphate isomerase [Pseudomonas asuensis]